MTVWSKRFVFEPAETPADRLRWLIILLSEDMTAQRWASAHVVDLYKLARGLDTTLLDEGWVCREDAEALTALANECGGWFVWSKEDHEPRFVPEEELKPLLAASDAAQRRYL